MCKGTIFFWITQFSIPFLEINHKKVPPYSESREVLRI